MDTLQKQVAAARRRLTLERFLRLAPWCCFAWLWVAAILIVVDKFQPLGLLYWAWPAMAMVAGVLTAAVWTFVSRRGSLDAAIEIDRRFALRERVSSSLALTPDMLETPAGKALMEDAVRRVERIHVPEKFEVKMSRWSLLPLAPAAAAFALALLWQPGGAQEAKASEAANVQKLMKEQGEVMKRLAQERQKELKEKNLPDAEKFFKKLEDGADRLQKQDTTDRKKALVELNDLAKDLEQRREALGGKEKIKEQFKAMKDMSKGPADKLAESLKEGDFQQAMKEIQQIRDQIKDGKLNEKQRDELAKQLEEMQSKLNKMADGHKQAMDELKKQIEQKKQAGDKEGAEKAQEQLDKLAQQMPQVNEANEMAKKLGECAKCMKAGQMEQAMAEMDGMEGQLKKMQAELDEMGMLDEAMEKLGECKACMNGGNQRNPEADPGMGMGQGRGRGDRPEDRTKTGTYATKVNQKLGPGSAVITDFVEGPNIKGDVQQQIQTQLNEVAASETDPLTGQQLPRAVREHAQQYFDKVREGK
ncbi:MAG: hypothetical protein SGJ19_04840 [Planctomycetia bacterium]|nr:hypothetical protein [Planctomycetia bacterium]